MRCSFYLLAFIVWVWPLAPAIAYDDLVLPKVDFSATDIHEVGALQTRQTIRYSSGKLRIDPGNGFSTTILDLTTQTECLLMTNHTYLVLPMDDELFRRFIARTVDMNGALKLGKERMEGLAVTKYAFGEEGALAAAGFYWLSDDGIMVKREYEDGVFGTNVHHRELLTDIKIEKQPPELFVIPPGYKKTE